MRADEVFFCQRSFEMLECLLWSSSRKQITTVSRVRCIIPGIQVEGKPRFLERLVHMPKLQQKTRVPRCARASRGSS